MEKIKRGSGGEGQLNLNGEVQPLLIPPVFIPVKGLINYFSKDDSIWESLKYFYNAELCNLFGLTREQLWQTHFTRGKIRAQNSVINNLKRLEKQFLIKCIRNDFGSKRNAKVYAITEKGKTLWEEYELYINREKTFF
jgi:hypothetical protein